MNAAQRRAIQDLLVKTAQVDRSPHSARRVHTGQQRHSTLQHKPCHTIFDTERHTCGAKRQRGPIDVIETQSIIRQPRWEHTGLRAQSPPAAPCCQPGDPRGLLTCAPCSEAQHWHGYGTELVNYYAQFPPVAQHVAALGRTDGSALGLLEGALRRHCPAAVFTLLEVWPHSSLAELAPAMSTCTFSCVFKGIGYTP